MRDDNQGGGTTKDVGSINPTEKKKSYYHLTKNYRLNGKQYTTNTILTLLKKILHYHSTIIYNFMNLTLLNKYHGFASNGNDPLILHPPWLGLFPTKLMVALGPNCGKKVFYAFRSLIIPLNMSNTRRPL